MEFEEWNREYKRCEGRRPSHREIWKAAQRHGTEIDRLRGQIRDLAIEADNLNSQGYSLDAFLSIFEKMHKLSKEK